MDFVVGRALQFLVPSWGEVVVSLVAACAVVLIYGYFYLLACTPWGSQSRSVSLPAAADSAARRSAGDGYSISPRHGLKGSGSESAKQKEVGGKLEWDNSTIFVVKLELLAAKNLMGANLNGTSDPYAVMECGSQKRFSSVVPGSRNPMWGEEFDFYVEELPAKIKISIYDWDIIWKSTVLGSTILNIVAEGQTEAVWYPLDSASGQVCLQTNTKVWPVSASGTTNGLVGAAARRRLSVEKPVATEVRQKPGPLETIFDHPPDEALVDSFSCALERSFLYHGRMYVSTSNICFHSNVFAKQLKVVLPLEDVEEINKSQHAFINPAITIILRMGRGGHGVPPLASPDGRAKYKFASFWNRNQAHRVLQGAVSNFTKTQEEAEQEQRQSALRAKSSSLKGVNNEDIPVPCETQPFVNEGVLVEIINEEFPCVAESFFDLFLSDDSLFTARFRGERKDTDLKIEQWHTAEQYSGLLRQITFRSLCHSPMCPPDTAVTELQHSEFSKDKRILILETVQQPHDVPFGSYFEIHVRWTLETTSESSCNLTVKVGAHFKKKCFMQSKIRSGSALECKKEAELIIRLAREHLQENKGGSKAGQEVTVTYSKQNSEANSN